MKKMSMAKVEPKNEIVVYQPDEVMRLEVRVLDESVWLTQAQIAELFGTKRPAITKHLTNIYKTGELERNGTCSILEHMGHDGVQQYRTAYYNLDAILAVGYRVNSREATQFRRWASSVLKEYLLRGYAFNARMNQLEDKMDRRFASHEKRLAAVEQSVDFVVRSALPAPEMVFFEGEFLAAHEAIRKVVKIAKRRLILIDNYIDERVLTLLAERRAGVVCRIYGKNVNKRDIQLAFSRFQQQYPNDQLQLTQWNATHDRFIVCDDTLWLCGSSVKDAGRRTSMLIKLETSPDLILSTLPTTR